MTDALYGPAGFYTADGAHPAGHFRTSVHASPLFTAAVLELVVRIDAALGRPPTLDVVDVGAGRGELLHALVDLVGPGDLARRLRLTAVEVAPRPAGLPSVITWRAGIPRGVVGLLLATEWLDNVPLDVVEVTGPGRGRRMLVDPATGEETPGGRIGATDAFWLARWWPSDPEHSDARAEVGWPRDIAWTDAVAAVTRGGALAVDYGHLRAHRPNGTLTGYRGGRQVPPVPDGSCDITAHVAMDAVAAAAGGPYTLTSQRAALRALGVDGTRPDLAQASRDPAGYLRALAAASAAGELTDPAGLGAHWWLLHGVGVDPAALLAPPQPPRASPPAGDRRNPHTMPT